MTVTEIIEQVREDMCNDFCRYTQKSREALDTEKGIYEKCEDCPLNRL